MTTPELDAFAAWVEDLMRSRGYDIDSPRGGGKSRIADEAGVHRAAVTRLLQRQSMPDLETTRRLARVLGVPVRDMLIRSGRLTAEELADPHAYLTSDPVRPDPGRRPTLEEVAELLGVPADRREMFVRVVEQFLPAEGDEETPEAGQGGQGGGRRRRTPATENATAEEPSLVSG
ncbi:helix-turn-helix transcriptional regulator [Streptomyces sp. TRM70350]|uniref:helix-turn-helix domain-containing protein n=1 Tax=Streptomyces sp. TRM70350 TaxID=2856165 RepID=UPI001C45E4B7|nr:helix-turn-helix transcriptional regulator [Streptomyces sp. TRM70350]MBV7697014.1 helix-turn-helix transcriptional regulator [Streptomyces sp. TRM70350]